MPVHLSARVAWHNDGWNGRVCQNPAANTFCVGTHSYPGEMIRERRDVAWETANAGRCCSELPTVPPCVYSLNAYGPKELTAFADPPQFFKDSTKTREWKLPPSTSCVWPYEEMYADDVKRSDGTYDYERRLEKARAYFKQIEPDQSLVFHYANYSNPFSEGDTRQYVVVGISRVKQVGDILFYENCSPEVRQKYGGGFMWQVNITSHYPDEGFRIPYHLYREREEVLQKILFVPDNPRNFKFGTRHVSDDEALDLVERFLEIAGTLREFGDTSENWSVRIDWLQQLVAELWRSRGLYPGLPTVLAHLGFRSAIPFFKKAVQEGRETEARDALVAFLEGKATSVRGLVSAGEEERRVVRQWRLLFDEQKRLLRDVLPRFDLRLDQIDRILGEKRADHGLYSALPEIGANPYILSEQFVGADQDDIITFNKVDHGIFPSPELGGQNLAEVDDWRRLRALCVERLKRESKDTFLAASDVIDDVNHKLSFLPEWKRHQFTERYLDVDEVELSSALTFRELDAKKYLYLRTVYEAERVLERELRSLANSPDIRFRSAVTSSHWHDYLHDPDSSLAQRRPGEYEAAIQEQVEVCERIFVRPICVLSGAAGTGKTTVVKAIIRAIEKAHGTGTSFQLLAPTGKAAERLRERTGKQAATVHSFLAQRGWLNDNLTFKRSGGTREDRITTYIIDEASMLDLDLMATLFRAINWTSVQRLILVGDPNQLPPIGRGRVFADVIDWLTKHRPESIGYLKTNIRQMENRLADRGTGILDLASLYVRTDQAESKDESAEATAEEMFRRVQEGGTVAADLRVLYWKDPDELTQLLTSCITEDMEEDTGQKVNPDRTFELWAAAFKGNAQERRPEYSQVITPYRGELFGTEHLNRVLQKSANGKMLDNVGELAGVTLFDKVIQVVNRPRSNPVRAWSSTNGRLEKIEVYNGEIGFAAPDLRDCRKTSGRAAWVQSWFRLQRFHLLFSSKPDHRVCVDGHSFVEENIELAYVISVHKSQGSEFERVYFILPKNKKALLSRELFYTGITRASRHCTILVEEDIYPLLSMRRPENSHLLGINSSLFEFRPVPAEFRRMNEWYEEGKIHKTLSEYMVRSKSEVIIANMLAERDITFRYEMPLFAPDGTFYLPDFTVIWRGEKWYWEHLGRLDDEGYRNRWETKKAWYDRFFPDRLIITEEGGTLTQDANARILEHFS